ncbi:calcineurin-like phosphoesterase family protein [Kineococcus xinjiangensis]|uniref:Calcineurin-like phosphoesterase family protein n=1 Tax=Kineococcus xinjiangensis TaxID=512762 RepID=A0A2S6IF67_9ACTN|nr:metallophosphoesterase [Kineococcus xinjiangensis]PPK92862.1 calcineurin-like phosphoesterase family protein [Kineococcus xinjiangensis]
MDDQERNPTPPAADAHPAGPAASGPAASPRARRWAPRWIRRGLAWLALLAVTALGAGLGAALAPGASTYVGPLQTEVTVRPSLHPGVRVDLPPAGQVGFATHRAPVLVTARITSVDLDAAGRLVRSPQQLLALEATAGRAMRAATVRAAVNTAVCSLAGAALAGFLVYRGLRRTVQTTATCLGVILASGALAGATFDPAALGQPRFTGVLSQAPYLVTNTRSALQRLQSYRSGLSQIVRDVSALYTASAGLPGQDPAPGAADLGADVTTLLHISDVHLNPLAYDLAQSLIEQFDVQGVVDTGDVTTWGSALESTTLSRIGGLGVPYVFVRGNHDSLGTAATVARQRGAVVLEDGQTVDVAGVRIAGIGDPRFTPDPEGRQPQGSEADIMRGPTEDLGAAITRWNEEHPADPVDVAVLHNPSALQPLAGKVPLVLAGHTHKRTVDLDASGTRFMVQGTTGSGGISSAALVRLSDGKPLPMSATLLHFAASGQRRGELIAYDEVAVAGLGLAAVQIKRTVVPAEETAGAPGSPDQQPGEPAPT